MQTVTGLFDSYDDARRAVADLESAGVAHHDISLIAREGEGERGGSVRGDHAAEEAGKGAGLGAALGGAGGLLAGLGLLVIPGLGPVVAAGWLASTAVGAVAGGVAGAATGGLVGALTSAGVSDEDAHVYAESVRRGGTLVTARVNDSAAAAAKRVLHDPRSVDVGERRSSYRQQGWTSFDPEAPPREPTLADRLNQLS